MFISGETTAGTCQIKGSVDTGVDMEAVKRKISPFCGIPGSFSCSPQSMPSKVSQLLDSGNEGEYV
jgi:hypothetical protein